VNSAMPGEKFPSTRPAIRVGLMCGIAVAIALLASMTVANAVQGFTADWWVYYVVLGAALFGLIIAWFWARHLDDTPQ